LHGALFNKTSFLIKSSIVFSNGVAVPRRYR